MMEHYLNALKQREEITQDVLTELEKRFTPVVEEKPISPHVPTDKERIDFLEHSIITLMMEGF